MAHELSLVDLRGDALVRNRVPTDAVHAARHDLGQNWAPALWSHDMQPDGLLGSSRLNEEANIAICDALPVVSARTKSMPDASAVGTTLRPTLNAALPPASVVTSPEVGVTMTAGVGVCVAQASTGDFTASAGHGPVSLSLLGQLQFGSLEPVNPVAYNNGHLFVAAGLGGLKIVTITLP